MIRILFIDDDQAIHSTLRSLLSDEYEMISALNGKEGIRLALENHIDVILLDISLPDMSGYSVLKGLSSSIHLPPVIMVSGFRDITHVVESVRYGAYDYISKPYKFEELKGTIRNALQNSADRATVLPETDDEVLKDLLGESKVIHDVKKLMCMYSQSNSTVLITGESGTGKELVAQTIHTLSSRREQVFNTINSGAIPSTLIETELFGSVRGAFTDAVDRKGCFELSDMGTLLLDEIGEMSFQAQVKLLRVLEEKCITRIGSTKRIPVNVRVLAATNKDLLQEVQTGNFRQDLFFRINVLPIHIPPLRERKEDIPLLTAFFLEHLGSSGLSISPKAIDKLLIHDWPGNVRELRNVLERAIIISGEEHIAPHHIVFA